MATSLWISAPTGSPALLAKGRIGLEEGLEDFFGSAALEIFGGSGSMGWDVTVALSVGQDAATWIERLHPFLQEWGTPPSTQITTLVSTQDEDAEQAELTRDDSERG